MFLSGGEVFAHPDAVDIINHARNQPFSTQIFTNGTLITEEKLSNLPPKTSFFISFDTAVPERTVRGKMDYPKLKQCFEWMQKYDHLFRTAVSVHTYNIDDIEEIFDWCAINGFPRPQWLETHPLGRALLHPDIIVQKDQVDKVFPIYRRCMEKYVVHQNSGADAGNGAIYTSVEDDYGSSKQKLLSIQTIKFCQRLERATSREKCARSMIYVRSDGNVYPCSNCMSSELFCGGNVMEKSFLDIWDNGFDAIRAITFDDHSSCKTCPVAEPSNLVSISLPPSGQKPPRRHIWVRCNGLR